MVLSKRERSIVVVLAIAIAIMALDYFVLNPLLDRRSQLAAEIDAQKIKSQRARSMIDNSERMRRKWNSMVSAGLKTDASSAESRVLNAVRDWAQETGLVLSSVKPERAEQDKQFQKIIFRATATGTMASTSQFLWRIQTATIPVRVTDLQLNSRKDGVDDLALQIGISTLCLSEAPANPASPNTAATKEAVQ